MLSCKRCRILHSTLSLLPFGHHRRKKGSLGYATGVGWVPTPQSHLEMRSIDRSIEILAKCSAVVGTIATNSLDSAQRFGLASPHVWNPSLPIVVAPVPTGSTVASPQAHGAPDHEARRGHTKHFKRSARYRHVRQVGSQFPS